MATEQDIQPACPDIFNEFNQSRQILAKQFYDFIELVANCVFAAKLNIKNPNLMEEINQQHNLSETEKNVLRNLYFYTLHLLNSKFLVGVMGRFKAGKSTLLNAVAGEDISPIDTRISTGVLLFTYHSEAEECFVRYDSGAEVKITPEEKHLYVDARHNLDNEKAVHCVRHGSSHWDLQKEIIFVDTPGLEAVSNVHEKITLDFVTQCHAAIVVSGYPPFGETELKFYERIQQAIPHVFLVQNLPADKLGAWIELEAQTLENLHKLSFYNLSTDYYGNQDPRQILRKIADNHDAEALARFKEIHNIRLYSVNALAAYEVSLRAKKGEPMPQDASIIEQSRFLNFKQELYTFLAQNKGKTLLDNHLFKGKLVLSELLGMVETKKRLLQQSLSEIEKQIEEHEQRRDGTSANIDNAVDRVVLKIINLYKVLKTKILEQDLPPMLGELTRFYGDTNIYRLHKEDVKKIKGKFTEFKRLFAQSHDEFVQTVQTVLEHAQDEIARILQNHSLFKPLQIHPTQTSVIDIQEIQHAGAIDSSINWVYRGGMTFAVGSLAGGGGISLLVYPLLAIGVASGMAPLLGALIGGAIGLGVSFPLEKYLAPFLGMCKGIVGKIVHRPVRIVLEQFREEIRQKLEVIETTIVERITVEFREEVSKNAREFLEFFGKTLQELKEKKSHGLAQQEYQKLEEIAVQLHKVKEQFDQFGQKADAGMKLHNIIKGITGFIKKFIGR